MTKAGEIYDLRRGMNEELEKQYRENTENFYREFVTKVANNRDMEYSEVLKYAGGRIWRGDTALELGLIDKLGSIDDAIDSMVTKLELEDYKVEYYGEELSPKELLLKELIDNFDVSVGEPRVLRAISDLTQLYETLMGIQEPKALLTCENCLVDFD